MQGNVVLDMSAESKQTYLDLSNPALSQYDNEEEEQEDERKKKREETESDDRDEDQLEEKKTLSMMRTFYDEGTLVNLYKGEKKGVG